MRLYQGGNDFTTTLRKALDEIDPYWEEYDGLIVPGSHKPDMIEEKIEDIREARETGLPFLGVCLGHQIAAIEYARNVLSIQDATSEEFSDVGTFVVKRRSELKVGLHKGQSYWNNYEVDLDNWIKPSWFFTTQYHWEYQSSKDNPHPVGISFLMLCRDKHIAGTRRH